jgi:DNA topoisomerase-1
MLVEKSSKRGKIFYSCNQYPKCDFALWDWPVDEPCPQCDSKVLTIKTTKARGKHIACPEKSCRYTRSLGGDNESSDDSEE